MPDSTVIFKAFMNHHLIQYFIHKTVCSDKKKSFKGNNFSSNFKFNQKKSMVEFCYFFFMSDIICQCCQPWAIAKLFGNHIRLTTNVFKKCHVVQINESKRVVKLHPNETLRKFDYGNIVHRWTTHPMFTIML